MKWLVELKKITGTDHAVASIIETFFSFGVTYLHFYCLQTINGFVQV